MPNWLIVNYGRGRIDWEADQFFVSLEAPFQRKRHEDFIDDEMSFSVAIEDIMRDILQPTGFAVNLRSVLRRIHALKAAGNRFDHYDIDQFIIQMADVEEIMQMDVRPFYDWTKCNVI